MPKIDPAIAADRQLVEQCLAGDVAAWSRLYQQSHDALLATVRSFLGRAGCDRNLVEEVAARVWYAVVKDDFALLARFDARRGCRLSTFLSVLAKSETRMLFRSERRRRSREQLVSRPELDGEAQSPAATLSDEEFVATLSPAERTYYLDVLVAPAERRELAERGYSSENIWQLNYRVRKKLERFILDSTP
jgi:DNA-directed RNA polymerase specialized sigma24 family protein